jgi:hypothetical protein
MLVPSTTERVIDNVHCDTTHTWPVGCGVLHLVILVACFHKRFLDAPATGYNPDGRTAACVEPFGFTAGHPDTDAIFNLVNHDCLNAR